MNRFKILNWEKWVNNSLVFLAPLMIMYLLNVQALVTKDGFQTTDLALDDKMVGAMMLYLINIALDFFKKYRQAN